MSNLPVVRTAFTFMRHRLALGDLKRCPLCDAVNSRLNTECFVCRWSGEFDNDPDSIQEGLHQLVERCPELIEALPVRERLINRAFRGLLSRFRRRLDLRA